VLAPEGRAPPGAGAARSPVVARSRSHGCGVRLPRGAGGSRVRGAGGEDFRGAKVQESIGRRLRGNSGRRERTRGEEQSFEAGEGVATRRPHQRTSRGTGKVASAVGKGPHSRRGKQAIALFGAWASDETGGDKAIAGASRHGGG